MPILASETVLNDDYQVERFLGEGAFAEVYKVQHRFLGRQAMKVFKTPTDSDEDVHRMLSEAILLSKIGHPNIIRVFNAGVISHAGTKRGFFTMELVPGGTLDRHWRSFGRSYMPVSEAVGIVSQVATGVGVAHAERPSIVHRDIKPQNILVGYDSAGIRVRVGDFGLAKHVNPMTLLMSSRGTIGFKPPEALENLDSTAGDVWAMGCVLYLLLTDEHPFPEAMKRGELVTRHQMSSYRPPSIFNIGIDGVLDEIVARCLRFEINDRYADAAELYKDLHAWQCASSMTSGGAASPPPNPAPKALMNGDRKEEGSWQEELAHAMKLSRSPGSLSQAADLLEELMSRYPILRERHETTIRLWRRGISM
jgi:serine/threonine protein kinase